LLLALVLTITAIIFLILIMKLEVEINITQKNKDFEGKVRLFLLFRLIRYTISIPAIDMDKETPSLVFKEKGEGTGPETEKKTKLSVFDLVRSFQKFRDFLKDVKGFYIITEKFLSKVTVSKLEWRTWLGAGDAAGTGQTSGLLWSVKGSLTGILSRYMKLSSPPSMEVYPQFQHFMFATVFRCMVSFRIGYAILAGIKVLLHRRKIKKRQRPTLNHQHGRNLHV
jgi:hypothetical protein